jgi:hypothetical protein
VKALKISLNLEEILRRVRERGEWRINELEKGALKNLGETRRLVYSSVG